MLSTEGFHAVVAEDGLEALHLLRTVRHRAPDVPCLVLLDLAMPRLGGTEFRRAQLGDPTVASVPVAVMSGAIGSGAARAGHGRGRRPPPSPSISMCCSTSCGGTARRGGLSYGRRPIGLTNRRRQNGA